MKKINRAFKCLRTCGLSAIVAFFGMCTGLAQSINVTSAGVGIGTAAPTSKLDVNGQVTIEQKNFGGTGGLLIKGYSPTNNHPNIGLSLQNTVNTDFNACVIEGAIINNNAGSEAMDLTFRLASGGALAERMRITNNGNVGIGTSTPSSPLTVASNSFPQIYIKGNSAYATGIQIQNDNYSVGNYWYIANDSQGGLTFQHNNSDKFWMGRSGSDNVIFNAGNVGIGTTAPSQKLEVAGSVKATSFISATKTYADYVFNKDYKLATLSEVEKHIAAEGHLPGIPSEKEARANGIDLGDMQVRLLDQVEQLTLHMIEQEKRINRLEQENAALKQVKP